MSASTIRRITTGAAALGLAAGLAAITAGAASASTAQARYQPPRVATGSVAVSGEGYPVQYEQFLALQGFGRNHGSVDYTNWTYAEPGSGVYTPTHGADALVFTYQGSQYAHTLNGASLHLVALSNNRLAFSGTGVYGGTPAVNWTIKGQIINGKYVKAVISYDAPSTYKVAISGVIKPDGSLSGPADSAGQAGLTFAMPAGSFTSVLSYQAKVQSEKFQGRNVTFTFTIPNWVPGLHGIQVTDKAHDGGFGPRHDTFAQGGVLEQIVGGPGITVR